MLLLLIKRSMIHESMWWRFMMKPRWLTIDFLLHNCLLGAGNHWVTDLHSTHTVTEEKFFLSIMKCDNNLYSLHHKPTTFSCLVIIKYSSIPCDMSNSISQVNFESNWTTSFWSVRYSQHCEDLVTKSSAKNQSWEQTSDLVNGKKTAFNVHKD